jgi:LPXTG-motif cell wall-anchored protein
MKKTFAAIALAGSIAVAGAMPAMADHEAPTYPGGTTQGTVSDAAVAPGETLTFSGTGFEAGEGILITVTPLNANAPQSIGGSFSGGASLAVPAKVNVLLAPQTFNTTADSTGAFAFPITISEPGTYRLTAEGLSSGHTVSATVTVVGSRGGGQGLANTGANSGTGAPLANTGADSSLVLWSLVGAGALAAGATSVVIVRRRAKA